MKDVLISVKGQGGIGGEGLIELVTEGRFYKENDAYCISYKESGVTGMEGTTTTLRVEKGMVALIRTGTISSTFIFEVGKKNISHYATEYGVFTIGVQALEVNVDINDGGGMVSVVYSLDIFGRDAERNEFIMSVREV
ncbi:MAG: DUF1934 domain-containing protein [Clostridia bacterium]|nr:DUF1934 domain-containing protein [Clostridia bacterium]